MPMLAPARHHIAKPRRAATQRRRPRKGTPHRAADDCEYFVIEQIAAAPKRTAKGRTGRKGVAVASKAAARKRAPARRVL